MKNGTLVAVTEIYPSPNFSTTDNSFRPVKVDNTFFVQINFNNQWKTKYRY